MWANAYRDVGQLLGQQVDLDASARSSREHNAPAFSTLVFLGYNSPPLAASASLLGPWLRCQRNSSTGALRENGFAVQF